MREALRQDKEWRAGEEKSESEEGEKIKPRDYQRTLLRGRYGKALPGLEKKINLVDITGVWNVWR